MRALLLVALAALAAVSFSGCLGQGSSLGGCLAGANPLAAFIVETWDDARPSDRYTVPAGTLALVNVDGIGADDLRVQVWPNADGTRVTLAVEFIAPAQPSQFPGLHVALLTKKVPAAPELPYYVYGGFEVPAGQVPPRLFGLTLYDRPLSPTRQVTEIEVHPFESPGGFRLISGERRGHGTDIRVNGGSVCLPNRDQGIDSYLGLHQVPRVITPATLESPSLLAPAGTAPGPATATGAAGSATRAVGDIVGRVTSSAPAGASVPAPAPTQPPVRVDQRVFYLRIEGPTNRQATELRELSWSYGSADALTNMDVRLMNYDRQPNVRGAPYRGADLVGTLTPAPALLRHLKVTSFYGPDFALPTRQAKAQNLIEFDADRIVDQFTMRVTEPPAPRGIPAAPVQKTSEIRARSFPSSVTLDIHTEPHAASCPFYLNVPPPGETRTPTYSTVTYTANGALGSLTMSVATTRAEGLGTAERASPYKQARFELENLPRRLAVAWRPENPAAIIVDTGVEGYAAAPGDGCRAVPTTSAPEPPAADPIGTVRAWVTSNPQAMPEPFWPQLGERPGNYAFITKYAAAGTTPEQAHAVVQVKNVRYFRYIHQGAEAPPTADFIQLWRGQRGETSADNALYVGLRLDQTVVGLHAATLPDRSFSYRDQFPMRDNGTFVIRTQGGVLGAPDVRVCSGPQPSIYGDDPCPRGDFYHVRAPAIRGEGVQFDYDSSRAQSEGRLVVRATGLITDVNVDILRRSPAVQPDDFRSVSLQGATIDLVEGQPSTTAPFVHVTTNRDAVSLETAGNARVSGTFRLDQDVGRPAPPLDAQNLLYLHLVPDSRGSGEKVQTLVAKIDGLAYFSYCSQFRCEGQERNQIDVRRAARAPSGELPELGVQVDRTVRDAPDPRVALKATLPVGLPNRLQMAWLTGCDPRIGTIPSTTTIEYRASSAIVRPAGFVGPFFEFQVETPVEVFTPGPVVDGYNRGCDAPTSTKGIGITKLQADSIPENVAMTTLKRAADGRDRAGFHPLHEDSPTGRNDWYFGCWPHLDLTLTTIKGWGGSFEAARLDVPWMLVVGYDGRQASGSWEQWSRTHFHPIIFEPSETRPGHWEFEFQNAMCRGMPDTLDPAFMMNQGSIRDLYAMSFRIRDNHPESPYDYLIRPEHQRASLKATGFVQICRDDRGSFDGYFAIRGWHKAEWRDAPGGSPPYERHFTRGVYFVLGYDQLGAWDVGHSNRGALAFSIAGWGDRCHPEDEPGFEEATTMRGEAFLGIPLGTYRLR